GFVRDAVFLTKAGAVGVAYRLNPPDSECLDEHARGLAAARAAQMLKQLSDRVHLYFYLLKRPLAPERPLPHPNPTVNAALPERARFVDRASGRFYASDHYMVVLHDGLTRGLRSWTKPWHVLSTVGRSSVIDHQLDRAIDDLLAQAQTCAGLLSDVV